MPQTNLICAWLGLVAKCGKRRGDAWERSLGARENRFVWAFCVCLHRDGHICLVHSSVRYRPENPLITEAFDLLVRRMNKSDRKLISETFLLLSLLLNLRFFCCFFFYLFWLMYLICGRLHIYLFIILFNLFCGFCGDWPPFLGCQAMSSDFVIRL